MGRAWANSEAESWVDRAWVSCRFQGPLVRAGSVSDGPWADWPSLTLPARQEAPVSPCLGMLPKHALELMITALQGLQQGGVELAFGSEDHLQGGGVGQGRLVRPARAQRIVDVAHRHDPRR